ncbi:MAG: SDR family NAD(P)-dependent oxidoreductase [Saccharofermentans sp.]|nr:SDR family NAD(P)-dependent oxidoreductase [Mageeibacillus sp.]MCI1264339.1 SDR family NAD(P)-dependent oxidoreductase [Saccharofermentans sp.]MCI1275252.1 SDR family NAD(P)-dependent oxidoreductase [Saccharofermentans sp.]
MKRIAIITGASSGIGEAFLRLLSGGEKFDGIGDIDEIWIVARRIDKLTQIKSELSDDRIRTFAADVTKPEGMSALGSVLEYERPVVGLLINCAGVGFKGRVIDMRKDVTADTLNLNCVALGNLTGLCLPFMRSNETTRIINIGSSAGFLPQPGFAAYAASKAFVISYSRALAEELRSERITVTTICPGPVRTDFQSKATGGRTAEFTGLRKYVSADAGKLARASLKAAGKGRRMLVYKFSQKALHLASRLLPVSVFMFFERRMAE